MKYSSLGNEISKNLAEQAQRRSECERTIVGSILLEPKQFPIVASIVASDDFANNEFRGLYRLIELMHVNGEPVSSATVMFAAKRSGLMDVLGGPSEYGKIASEVSNAKHAEFYARELAKLSAASTVFNAAIELAKTVSLKSVDVVNAIEVFQCSINSTTTRLSKTATPVGDVILRIQESKERTLVGRKISTGFNELDGLVGGLFTKNLVLLEEGLVKGNPA